MERASAVRVVCPEIFAFLALVSAGEVVSILLWRQGVFGALICGNHLTDPWLHMPSLDMEVFYLPRPLFRELFMVLAVVAILALFREEFHSITRVVIGRLVKQKPSTSCGASPEPKWRSGNATLRAGLPLLVPCGFRGFGRRDHHIPTHSCQSWRSPWQRHVVLRAKAARRHERHEPVLGS